MITNNNNNNNDDDKDKKDFEDKEKALQFSENARKYKEELGKAKAANLKNIAFQYDVIFTAENLEEELQKLRGRVTSCLTPLPPLSVFSQANITNIQNTTIQEYKDCLLKNSNKLTESVATRIAKKIILSQTLSDEETGLDLKVNTELLNKYNLKISDCHTTDYVKFLVKNYGYPEKVVEILVQKFIEDTLGEPFSTEEKKIIIDELQANLGTFFNVAASTDNQIAVIAIGSAGSKLQMCPPFVPKNGKACILNIDPRLYDHKNPEQVKELTREGLDLRCSTINCLESNANKDNLMYKPLLEYIEKYLQSSKVPLAITYQVDAYIPELFLVLAKKYPEAMREGKLILVHAYFDYLPVLVYSPEYLTNPPVAHLPTKYGYIGALESALFTGVTLNTDDEVKAAISNQKNGNEAYKQVYQIAKNLSELTTLNILSNSKKLKQKQ